MKKFVLKFACVILVFSFIFTSLSATAFAQESYTYQTLQLDEIRNPLHEDTPEEFSIKAERFYSARATFDINLCISDDNAIGTDLREAMVNRDACVNIYYKSNVAHDGTTLQNKLSNWLEIAFAETGISYEGDYLRWSYEVVRPAPIKCIFNGANYYYYIPLSITYYTTKAQEITLVSEIDRVLKGFNFDSNTTDREKSDKIYDFITGNTKYDYDNLNDDSYVLKFTAYAALINKKAVCQGYATLFYRMALECGLSARVIIGRSKNQNHAWNIVKIGNSYYFVDSTWDSGEQTHLYYLKGSDDFAGHTIDQRFLTQEFEQKYPISKTNFDSVNFVGSNENFVYTKVGDKIHIKQYKGKGTEVTVPSVIDGYAVEVIDEYAFSNAKNLKKVVLPNTINSIGAYAFENCDGLTHFEFPSGVKEIKRYTLFNCDNISSIIIPDGVTFIGDMLACDNRGYTIYGKKGGIANQFADTNNLKFKVTSDFVCFDGHDIEKKYINGYSYHYACKNCNDASKTYTLINISTKNIKLQFSNATYNGQAKHPKVEVEGLQEQKDFKVAYKNNVKAGTATVIISGIGNYYGTVNRTFKINLSATSKVTAQLYGDNDVKLSWNKVDGANGYLIYYKSASTNKYIYKTSTTALTYNFANLKNNTKYNFKVVACHLEGKTAKASPSYKTTSITTLRNLSAPKKVSAVLFGFDDVKVSWSKVPYAKGYYVYYKTSSAKKYTYAGKTTALSFKKSNLSDGVKYTFKVVPYGVSGKKILLDDSFKTASVYTLKKLSAPKISKKSSKVKVSWTNINGESGYQISQSTSKSKTKIVATYSTTSGKTKTIKATKGKNYYYKVRAFKKVGKTVVYGPWSTVKKYKLK